MTERPTTVVPSDEDRRLSRRTVLKGLAASPLVLAACGGDDPAEDVDPTAVPEPTATATSADPTATRVPEPDPTAVPAPTPEPGGGGGGAKPGPLPVNFEKAVETWEEPWTWRPSEYPGEFLQLNVIEHETPSVIVGFGNSGATIFGYNGTIPGPTIRMRGDETYRLKVVNHLGLNAGSAPIGPSPDPAAFAPPTPTAEIPGVDYRADWCLGEHSNGVHSVHTTNMHTHGLHVRPGLNPADPDGVQTISDDIFTRLIPLADLAMREANRDECDIKINPEGLPLTEDERPGLGTYEFRLGDVQGDPDQPHPPGTHWYHPHAHGSTHNQVTSGLAGFLVIEGDVDEALNDMLAGMPDPDPAVPTGPYDYRERMMFIQRVNPGNVSHDPDALSKRLQGLNIPAVNGLPQAQTIVMRPGAIERWRLLNGSVDGKGYLRFMVLKGQWVHEVPPPSPNPPNTPTTIHDLIAKKAQLLRVAEDGVRHVPTTDEIEAAKAPLHQLSADGITLVRERAGNAEYYIKNLDFDAAPNPLRQDFTNLADCYRDAESLRACYIRPNELYMSPAQRADFLFQAPQIADCAGEAYTIIGKATAIHTGNEQRAIQVAQENLDYAQAQADAQSVDVDGIIKELGIGVGLPEDTIVGYVVVREFIDPKADPDDPKGMAKLCEPNGSAPPLPPADFDFAALSDELSSRVPVPRYLLPIGPEELLLSSAERAERQGLPSGGDLYRTRRSTYSGWGAATWPLFRGDDLAPFDTNNDVGAINPVSFTKSDEPEIGEFVVAPLFRTMAIDGRKFNNQDPLRPRMGLDTAEEWAVFNNSISVFGNYTTALDDQIDFTGQTDADKKARKPLIANRKYLQDHRPDGLPVTRAEADAQGLKITTRGIDHPFHIHINPMWVLRVEVPDENGNLVNVLPEPQWHDVMWLPRNAGRVVFRSRFPDFTGTFVNHCHILLHEDNGMMQEVEIVETAGVTYDAMDSPNYVASAGVIDTGAPYEAVYAPDSLVDAFRQCTRFIDNNPNPGRAQEFPAVNGVFNPPL